MTRKVKIATRTRICVCVRSRMDAENSAAGYRLLLEINNAIISNLTRESLFRAIAEALRKVVPFDRAILYDAENDVLRTFALEGPELPGHSHDLHHDVSRQGTAAGWVVDHGQSRLRRDIEIEPRVPADEIMVAGRVRAYVCVPLMARGRAIGALLLQSFAPNRYAVEDVPLLEEVAKQIALAVENMRAFEEIARLRAKLEEENRYLQEEIKSDHNFEEIVGQSLAIKELFKAIEAVAPVGATVLITGETGTGKELAARALHHLSPRRGKALIKVNCAALPAGLVESELFGHEKGAFTGAIARKIGRFELAHGGTLFLDEIGDLPLELQPKLLRVLQDQEFERLGSTHVTHVDARLIAATNRDLPRAVAERRFRSDLYYRLHVFPIRVPSLRDRKEDIPLLVRHFVQKFARRMNKKIESIPAETMNALVSWGWPGNVRELENFVERSVILSQGLVLNAPLAELWPSNESSREKATLNGTEREHTMHDRAKSVV